MRLRRLVVCSIVLALIPISPAFAAEPPGAGKLEAGLSADFDKVRAIVEVRDPAAAAPVAAQAGEVTDVVLTPESQPFIVVEGTGESLTELADDPRVVSIHRDHAYPPALASSVKVIGGDRAHADGVTGAGQTVAVLDTGIDRDHPAFAGRIVAEACFSSTGEDGVPLESLCPNGQSSQIGEGAADAETAKCLDGAVNLCDHGSHVAGIAAGAAGNGSPGAGVAPGANLIAVQIFSRVNDPEYCGAAACLLAFESTLRLALDHIATLTGTHKIAAVNLSVGGGLSDTSCDDTDEGRGLKPKIDALLAQGVPTVVAAGNEAVDGAGFPGCVSSAVTVGATDDGDAIADFSNRGPLLDLFAPGLEIDSAVPDDGYASFSGTSMAAPHVAGALALLRQKSPDIPATALVETLKTTGRKIVYGSAQTPRIDVYAALTGTAPAPPITQAPSPDDPGTGDPEQPGDDPTPTPTTDPPPQPAPEPTPVPVPTVTVTVTVTVTPTPAPAPEVCTRGKAKTGMTAAKWAAELGKGRGALSDATLTCYLSLVKKASKVFPEVVGMSTFGTASKVLKSKARLGRAPLTRELLAAWLNWAYGARDLTAKADGATTLKAALARAEYMRLDKGATPAQLARSTTLLERHVN
ncbi:S8 family serine peptidase [Streptosporangium soli]|nr:S8 family serine peptidase [Streptosporangium sp. KLBMP 9127]